MRRSLRQTVRGVVVEVVEKGLVVEAVGVVETIIRGMHASRANRAGSFLVF